MRSIFFEPKRATYYPEFAEFEKLCRQGNLIPIYREILADLETPLSAFMKLQPQEKSSEGKLQDYTYLLESVEKGERLGRYSFLGIDPFMIFESKGKKGRLFSSTGKVEIHNIENDPLQTLKQIMQRFKVVNLPHLPIFSGGAVGYVGYDVVKFWEKISFLDKKDSDFPDLFFIFTKSVVIFDHLDHRIKIISFAFLDEDEGSPEKIYQRTTQRIDEIVFRLRSKFSSSLEISSCIPEKREIESNFSPESFTKAVEKAKEYIRDGDIFQVVISQEFSRKISSSSLDIYRVLRSLNPSPYMYFLKCGDFSIAGSSPEILVRKEGKEVILRPIAGTRPRGSCEEDDARLTDELLKNDKERAEHIMLVDLGRNDLGRVCDYGTVKVKELFSLEKYSHVMHLVSEVRGTLRDGLDQFDLLRACFPAGTVSGAPKVRAMQIIEELEPCCRGAYGGALGYFSFSGNMDTCIIIRTMIVKGDTAYIQAGAGIVADSIPENEFKETVNKAKALTSAIELTEEGKGWFW
ncbi:anthranilate synthase component I [Candidatus Aerophobetes bacterium]|nr:anthranilate synthase component I [Candidatus Aerophobetes bacterium]